MLTSGTSRKQPKLLQKKALKEVSLFCFPMVKGLEEVSRRLARVEADSLFSALLQSFRLRLIKTAEEARVAEELLEYLERAFEASCPVEIRQYKEVLLMLIAAYDEKHYTSAAKEIGPALFLKHLLQENGLCQKDLVPDCFKSESQVSEFLHQHKGRSQLSYAQAVSLGSRFGVDPLNFLNLTKD